MVLGLAIAAGGPVRAADLTEADYAAVNAGIAQGHVVPRMNAFARATAGLEGLLRSFCRASGSKGVPSAVTARFHDALDSWMAVRHLNFGPGEDFMRGSRIQFAPDPDGRVAQAVKRLLAQPATSPLTVEVLAHESVAVQGFPALEQLLFEDGGAFAMGKAEPDAARCRVAQAIAGNLKAMAADMVGAWRPGGVFRGRFDTPAADNPFFATHKDATLSLFRAFYSGFDVIAALKLEPPLGKSLARVRPELVENRLTRRAIRNVTINLEALKALYEGEGGKLGLAALLGKSGKDAKLARLMPRAFAQIVASARAIPAPLARAVADPNARPRVEKLHLEVRALRQIIAQRLAPALGIEVGFNALDGD